MATGDPSGLRNDPEIADFDVHGALELHVQLGVPMPLAEKSVVVEDVTVRCMMLCLTAMQEVIQHVGGSGNMELFLSDVRALLRQLAKGGRKSKGSDGNGDPKIVEDIELQRFYSGAHTPMVFTKKLAAGLKEWSDETDVPLDNDAMRRICWKYYLKEKERVVTNTDWLSPECNYRLFLIYNRLLLKDDTTDLEVGQVNAFLMKMVQMLGFLWNLQHEYKAEGSSCVNFPEFVTLVTEYFQKLHLNTELTCELIGDLMDLLVNGVLKKGYLEKKGHLRKNWKRRFFVLKTDSLHYYRDRDQTDKKGVLAMNLNTKLIDIKDSEDPKHPNKFIVTCGKKGVAFEIVADSKQEKHSWMQAVTKAIALYQLNCSLSKKEFELSMAEWRRSTYGVESPESPTQTLPVPMSRPKGGFLPQTSVMKRQVREKVATIVMKNRTSMQPDDSSHSLEDHFGTEKAAASRQKASTQRTTGPYFPMHRSVSDPTSPGQLMDYEPMALTNTSSDSNSDDIDDDVYVNFASPQSDSGEVGRRSKGSTSSSNRQMGTLKEDVEEGSAESHRYVNFDPKDGGMAAVKEDVGKENKENHRYMNFDQEGDEEEVARASVSCPNGGVPVDENEDSHYVLPNERSLTTSPGVQKPHGNQSKPANQPAADTVNADIHLDLSDRGSRRKPSQRKPHEVVTAKTLQKTLALERSQSVSSDDGEDGSYITPTDIASYPTPTPRKIAGSKRETSVSSESDLYLQMKL